MSRRDYLAQNIAVPLVVNLWAAILFVVAGPVIATALDLPLQIVVATAVVAFIVVVALTQKQIRRRYLALRVVQEVSSSRCGDQFLALGRLLLSGRGAVDAALLRLKAVESLRPYPNSRFLSDMVELTQGPPGGEPVLSRLTRYLEIVGVAKSSVRADVVEILAAFIRDLPPEVSIVIYAYSSTVCDGLVRALSWLSSPIFLVEDLQYGREGSLGEHVLAQRHLERQGLHPIQIPFDQIHQLIASDSDFVRSVSGSMVPLPKQREIVALIGCEAMTVNGDVLIPSRLRGLPSETAKFVEVFRRAEGLGDRPSRVVVVGESYKVYGSLPSNSTRTSAPSRPTLWRDFLYLVGAVPLRAGPAVELVTMRAADVDAVVDDTGIHREVSSDLGISLASWSKRSVGRLTPTPGSGPGMKLLNAASTIVFDLNGVLLDDEAAHFAAFADAMGTLRASLTYDEYVRFCSGHTDEEGMAILLRAKGITADPAQLLRVKRDRYALLRGGFDNRTFPGAVELAKQMHADGKDCYLVTSSDPDTVRGFLDATGLVEVFPEPLRFEQTTTQLREEAYRAIIAATRNNPSACVVIDDSPANLAVARRLSMKTIGVATTVNSERLSADFVFGGPVSFAIETERV